MEWRTAPMVPLAAAFAAGLLVAPWVAIAPLWILAGAGALLAAGAGALARGRERLATITILALAVVLGTLRGGAPPLPADHIARRALPASVTVEGELLSEPTRWAADRTRLLLNVAALLDGSERRPMTGRIQLTMYGETVPLGQGQHVAAQVRLHRPIGFRNPGAFDYPAYLRREGIFLVGSGRADRLTPLTPDSPPWPARVKRWAVETIGGQLPGPSAPLLAGLLLGERATIPPQTDEAFRRAGVYHVLAVSGFNVALLASCVFFSLSLIGVPRRVTAIIAGAVLVGFALVVGGHPSVLRATVMGLVLLLAVLLEREAQILNGVALAGLALLAWRPGDLWDPGFQLSFAATLGIIHLAPGVTAFLSERGCPRWLAASIAVSFGAQLAVTPIMLVHFNQLSLIGVLANLAVVPLSAAATALGVGALMLSIASEAAAGLIFNALWLVLLLLRATVWFAAALPAAMVHLPAPALATVAAWYGAMALVPLVGTGRRARAAAVTLLLVVIALSTWPWLRPSDGRLRVTFLDVGQGDTALVELPEGQRILIDGGPGGPWRFDVGEHVVAPFLWNRATGRLEVVTLSHSDPDHSGGLTAILRYFRVGEFWENGRWDAGTELTLQAVERSGAIRRVLERGQRLWVGSALITVLHPDGEPPPSENDRSLVLRLDWRGLSMLFTGDLGREGEAQLLDRGEPLRSLLLKVAHHGSRFSTSPAFLEAARPALAVISAGPRNPFRHPTPETLGRLAAVGARVYRTDRDGAVLVESDGVSLWITRWARGATERFDLDPERAAERPDSTVTAPEPVATFTGAPRPGERGGRDEETGMMISSRSTRTTNRVNE